MITSVKNEKVKSWKKLQKRKERENTGTFLIEGFHLVEEAWKSDWKINEIIVQEGVEIPAWMSYAEVIDVSDNVFEQISQTQTPQGIAAVVAMNPQQEISGNRVLLIDAVQDPGNLGTIIRTADAAGFDGIILGDGTVDLYNDKVIRSTQGSLFHMNLSQRNLTEAMVELQQDNFSIWATALENATNYNQTEIDDKVALILGNEGSGVNKELIEQADKIIKIPIYGEAESLNVSIAAGILMYYVKG